MLHPGITKGIESAALKMILDSVQVISTVKSTERD